MEGSHQPIITKEEFAQVRKILDSKSFLLIIEGAEENMDLMIFGAIN